MEKLVFNGRTRVAGLPGELDRTIAFLLEKKSEGSFQYSSSVEDWENAAEFIEDPLNLGWRSHELTDSVGLAYIAVNADLLWWNCILAMKNRQEIWPKRPETDIKLKF